MLRGWRAIFLLPLAQGAYGMELSEADFLGPGTTVLSASRLRQPLMDTPNAVTILDRATLEASGYHDFSDLFRLVPGIYVGRMNGWFHNVTHTMADEYARRMQVLVDGRSVYLPMVGGVRWDLLPLAIDDIERIEVVRGPNAATFGANAYTGVINIITRHPEDVRGRMLHAVVGDHAHREGWFRWAGSAPSGSHRLTLGHRQDGGFSGLHDNEDSRVLNYRGEFDLVGTRSLGVQAGVLYGERGDGSLSDVLAQPHEARVRSRFAQLDYRLPLSGGGEWLGKLSYDHLTSDADIPTALLAGSHYEVKLDTTRWHGEFQFNGDPAPGMRTTWGGYLRRDGVRSYHYLNTHDAIHVDSRGVFAHLEWRMTPTWLLNTGAFHEKYPGVGSKLSPRLTLNWQPHVNHTLRAGVSRAYRNPVVFETRADWRLRLLDANGGVLGVFGPYIRATGQLRPENMLSREISYLGLWPEAGIALDVRLFKERIGNVISAECATGNNCKGLSPPDSRDFVHTGGTSQTGLETQFKWRPSAQTQVLVNYALLHIDSHFDERRYSPRYLAGLHLMHTLPGEIGLTLSHYRTAGFEPIGQGALPASRRWDMRLAKFYRLRTYRAELALGVENLGDAYYEFSKSPGNQFDTRAYLHLKLHF
ncbi:MAG TPA: TonB-dependent receptor [Thiobacillaceae bacterium]|nr:TonB-dependent receptor [Thiobacillaceae bacterium]HNU62964.1 TonB-dependent receptor [Thiobacillaceae bacterium]